MKSFKSEERVQISEENWYSSENMHEAIVDEFTFHKVQKMLNKKINTKVRNTKTNNIFANILYCMDCRKKLSLTTRKRKTYTAKNYRCSSYINKGKGTCSPHSIDCNLLYNIVLLDIKKQVVLAKDEEQVFMEQVYNLNKSKEEIEQNRIESTIKGFDKRLYDLENLIQKTFEKNCEGILPDEVLKSLLRNYNKEKNYILSRKERLLITYKNIMIYTNNIKSEISKLKKHYEIEKLTRHILTSLIEKIYIRKNISTE